MLINRRFLFLPVVFFLSACATQIYNNKQAKLVWTTGSPPYDTYQQNKALWESKSAGLEYWYITRRLVENYPYYLADHTLVKVIDNTVVEMYFQRESLGILKELGFFEPTISSPRSRLLQKQKNILTINELFTEIDAYNIYVDRKMNLVLGQEELDWQDKNYSKPTESVRLAIRKEYQQSKLSREEFVSGYFGHKHYNEVLGYPTGLSQGCPFELIFHCRRSVSISDVHLGKIVDVQKRYGKEWVNWKTWLQDQSSNNAN